jgi:hypothetical protein
MHRFLPILGALCLLLSKLHADAPSFHVLSFVLHQNTNPPNTVEWPAKLDVEANITSASAEVAYTVPSGEWTISFIQQINSCVDRHDYVRSMMTWEMPRLPYCDAEPSLARKGQFWYLTGVDLKSGSGRMEITFGDNPSASYSWDDLAPSASGAPQGDHDLVSAEKRYSFTCWLAAMRKSDKTVILLKRFDWKLNYYYSVNATEPLGRRAHYVAEKSQNSQPVASDPQPQDLNDLLRSGVLSGKESANRDQVLWWTSKHDPNQRFQVK